MILVKQVGIWQKISGKWLEVIYGNIRGYGVDTFPTSLNREMMKIGDRVGLRLRDCMEQSSYRYQGLSYGGSTNAKWQLYGD